MKDNKDKREAQKSTLGKVLKRIKKYSGFLVISILMAAVTVASTLYVPILVGRGIDHIIGPGNVDFAGITKVLITIGIVVAITALSQWIMNICNNKITYHVTRDIRDEAMEKLQKLPLKYIDAQSYGDIVSRVIADVDQFADGLLMGFTQFFSGVLTIAGTLIFMLTINVKITLVVVVITPVSLFVASFIAKKTFSMFKLQSETRGEQTAFIDEMIGGQKVVKAYGYEERAVEEFDEINKRLQKYSLRAIFFSSITNPSTRFVNSLVYAAVAVAGAFSAIGGGITVGQLSSFLSYATQYTKPFNEISGVITELQNAIACAGRMFELIEEEPEIPDAPSAVSVTDIDGRVDLNNVYFSYTPDRKLIEDFTLHVKKGQKIAIVGPTGCGKTTVINLLMRFYDVNSGSIDVSGVDIRDMTRYSLRHGFGMVLQETWLKAGTIRENITMGKPDATEEEIIEAAKASYSYGFIKRLPNGFDTVIGEDGGSLSQGQKQLLCITRIMLTRPPMLILDEATSSIDTRTEIKIQNAFNKLMEGRTSFIVAHRLSTIQSADVILVMKDGHIIERVITKNCLRLADFIRTYMRASSIQQQHRKNMRLYITDISDVTEDMFNTGKMLVPEYRQEKIDRYQYMEDKRRSLVAGLLLNYATKDYEAGNYIAHNYITGNCVDKNYLIEASKRERENIHAGHLWESNSEYDIDINKLISGYDKAYDYDIKLTANNKPEYADKNIHFNLSHTGDYVVCAISENAVGVDIEHTRKNYLKVARRFFTDNECRWIGEDENRFLRIWTLKEAYSKYTGQGIALTISDTEFRYEKNDKGEDIINGYINKDKITNINIVQLNNIKSEYVISAIEKTFY